MTIDKTMQQPLTLAVVQFSPVFGEKVENLRRLEHIAEGITADIIVFPELCTTGYFFLSRKETAQYAEPVSGPTVQAFRRIAQQKNAVVIAGFAESDGGALFNSSVLIQPEQNRVATYRKSHLFYKERFCFDPGDTGFFSVYDSKRDVNIGLMICYDWRFPEVSRALALHGADIIVCSSNLVTDAWRLVMPARAIENKVYVAVANRAGTESREGEELLFKGNSAIYGYNGAEMAKASAIDDEVIYAEIMPQHTRDKSFNALNDVLRDRRPDLYSIIAEARS